MGKIDDQEKCERGSKSNLNRESRNKSEKDRRDKVNAFINELANLVPGCVPQSKKLDKATILKNTVDFMKVHNDLTVAITRKDATSCLNSNEIGQLMLEGYNSFLFVISSSGHFKFISESIYDLLGYVKDDLFEKNIFDYIYPEDKLVLLNQVSQDKIGMTRNSGMSSFKIRFKANVHGKPCYEVLRCCGNFRLLEKGTKPLVEENCLSTINEACFVVLAKLIETNCYRDVSNWLNIDVEFASRQSLDGKFLYLDPRCIPITGYLPYEILGSLFYEFVHFDDLENISTSFEALFEDGEGETEEYRLLTKGNQWIVVKTTSYISYNHWNSKPEFICSTHQLIRKPSKYDVRGRRTDDIVNDLNSGNTWKIERCDNGYENDVFSPETSTSEFTNSPKKCAINQGVLDKDNNSQTTKAQGSLLFSEQQTTSLMRGNNDGNNANVLLSSNYSSGGCINYRKSERPAMNNNFCNINNFGEVLYNPCETEKYWGRLNSSKMNHNASSQSLHNNNEQCMPTSFSNYSLEIPSKVIPQLTSDTPQSIQISPHTPPSIQISPHTPPSIQISPHTPPSIQISPHTPPSIQISPHTPPSIQISPQSYPPHSSVNLEITNGSVERSSVSSTSSANNNTKFPVSTSPLVFMENRNQKSPSSLDFTAPTTKMNFVSSPMSSNGPIHIPSKCEKSIGTNQSPTSSQRRIFPDYAAQYPPQSPQISDQYTQPQYVPSNSHNSSLSSSLSTGFTATSRVHHTTTGPLTHNPTMPTALSLSHQTISNFPRSNYNNVERPQLPVTSQGYFHPLSQTSQHIPPSSSQCLFNEKSKGRTALRSLSNSSLIFPVPSEGTTSSCRQVELRKPSDASLQFYGEGSDVSGNSLLPFERRSSTNQTTQQYARPNNVTPLFSALNVPQPQLNSPASDERESFSNQHISIGRNNQPSCVSAQGQSLSSSEESFMASSAKSLAYIKAQKILQSQLLDKQNHLQQIIVNQKAQLNRIQEQIIVNAQAQFSLHDIGDLESSKQLQQRIHSLETERQKHEEKHKELQILFQQKFQEVSPLDQYDTNEALEDTSKHIPASDVDSSRTSRDAQKCDNFLVQPFSSASTAPKTFEYKRYPSQQTSSSAQDIEDDLFSGVVATEKAKQQFSHFYSPIMQTFNTPYKIAASQETMNHTKVVDSQNIGTFSTVNATNNHGKDYFSQFSTSELESFLSSSTYPAKSLAQNADRSESNAVNEKSSTTPSTYDSLLLQQKRLLEMQEEQRRELLKRQQEQFLRLKLQQQQQQQMLVDLQHSDKDEINDPQPSSQNISEGGIVADDSSCVITNELNEDDLNVLNMLLAEEAGTEMWTEESIFQKAPSSSSS